MRIEVTKAVANHHTNAEYPTLRVRWLETDRNFMVDGEGPNWCPTDRELLDLVNEMVLVSPTFYAALLRSVRVLKSVRGDK